jgi:hypothetical protein
MSAIKRVSDENIVVDQSVDTGVGLTPARLDLFAAVRRSGGVSWIWKLPGWP